MATLGQIEKHLERLKLPYETIKLNEEAYTVKDVVKSGIDLGEVVKTLVARGTKSTKSTKGFIALALRGGDRVDFKIIRERFGSKCELAKPGEVLKIVGVPIGAVCPILIGIPIYIDQKVMKLTNVHMGSGDLKYGLEMELKDLLSAIGDYRRMDFALEV